MTAITDDPQWKHRTARGNGVDLHIVEQGDGPLMLFLHGFPEFWYSWRHQMAEFAADYHVVAPDMRGYNKSDKPRGRRAYALAELVADVRALIEDLGYEKCVLVAHDWGGAVAWEFAHRHPEMLERLVAMNMPHPVRFYEGLSSLSQLRRSWYILYFQLPWLPEKLLSRHNYEAITQVFANQAKNPEAFSARDLDAYRKAVSQPGALTAMLNYYRNLPIDGVGFDPDSYQMLEVPTLMLWGEDDAALGKELTYGTERLVRDLRIEYIPDCSHWIQQDRPEQVNELMREFL